MVITRFKEALRHCCVDACLSSFLYGKSSPPPAPDYVGAATAQGAANKDAAIATAQLSNPNVENPYGSQTVTYTTDPTTGNPIPNINQTLSSSGQTLFDQYNQINQGLGDIAQKGLGSVQSTLDQPFDWSKIAAAPVNAGTTGQYAIMARLQPQIQQQNDAFDQQMANQGIAPGSEAYTNAKRSLSQSQNDLLSQAALQGINLDTSARQEGIQEQEFARTEPLNIVNSLRSSAPVNVPQFQGYSGTTQQATPVLAGVQAQGTAQQNAFNAQVAQQNATTSGLFSLGAAGLGAYGALGAAGLAF